jgi:hypothetical protein
LMDGFGGRRETNGVVPGAHHAPVAGYGDAGYAHVVFGDQLVAALVLAQIPDAHIAAAVAADQLALIRVDHDVVDRHAVGVVPLDVTAAGVPDLDRAVLAAGHEPFRLAVERNAGYVAGVSVEGEDRVGVRGFDVVQLDRVVAGGGEVALVGRDAEAVYLRVGVRDCTGADAGQGFPEAGGSVRFSRASWSSAPDCVVIASCVC